MVTKSNEFQKSRYELKFLIDESMAAAISHFVRTYLEPDPHMPADSQRGYWLESVYLDSTKLALYQQTKDGVRNRFKLRIRYYDETENAISFLELKYRKSDTVHKQRCRVTKTTALKLLDRGFLSKAELLCPTAEQQQALRLFCERMDCIQARPRLHVRYLREAYVPRAGNLARVTFDRELTGFEYNRSHANAGRRRPVPVLDDGQVVMELKFTDQFPYWMRELTHTFGLRRNPYPKYVRCVDAMSPFGFGSETLAQ